MLKEKFEQAKDFVVEHKKEIGICVGTIVGGVVLWKVADKMLIGKASDVKITTLAPIEYVKENIPDGLKDVVGEISHPESVTEWTDVWLKEVNLSELGDFGQKLAEIEGFDENSIMTGIVALHKVSDK